MSFTPGGLLRRFFGSAVSNAAGYGVGGAILPTLEPLTQDIANETWAVHSVKPLAATTAAAADLRGLGAGTDWQREASYTGINADRYAALVELAADLPPTDELLDLLRRGVISDATFDGALQRRGMLAAWRPRVRGLRAVLPSVTDMVRFAVREVYDPGQRAALDLDAERPAAFVADAARIGLEADTAADYWAAHWQLPSYTEGVEMWHRGELTTAQLDGLLRALDYAPTWRAKLRAIAERIPPLTDMIRFAVREVYSPAIRAQLGLDSDYPAEFTAEAALHGMTEERARQYWAAHWRLPSAMQGYKMLHRGEINDAELGTLLRALDYPPLWRERLQAIAYLVPGRVDLRRMFKADVITEPEVFAGYQRLGYTAADARTLTDFAIAEKAGGATSRNETATELRDEYEGGFATEAQLRQGLGQLGYDPTEVDSLVLLGAARQVKTERGRVVTALHKLYVSNRLDDDAARTRLGETGMVSAAIDRIIPLWTVERDAAKSQLTAAQIRSAYRKNALTLDQAIDQLEARDYTEEDARVYLAS